VKPKPINYPSTLSSGASPSEFQVTNMPLASLKSNTIFFDSSLTMTELYLLGELCPEEPINESNQKNKRRSRSDCRNLKIFSQSVSKKPESSFKSRFFDSVQTITETEEEDSWKRLDLENEYPCVQLLPPPLERFKRRKERCALVEEVVDEKVLEGEVKRYSFSHRCGNLCYGNEKINVFEDDLVTSKINLNKFKRMVQRKEKIFVLFQIKKGIKDEKEVLKPVNIKFRC
jgi:hypothetical protein